ncbi:hypothetical protein FOCG_17464 [Fusarium oxysporum f. sp. radicis-lycopersici 26381]|nr:hypothetical protein FOCG_17464 [Fusarium oxysporum f. sp. radicis-lycopersici 26381]
MPTRLLYLGDVNSKVWRIYQDPGHVPYAALSHRWSSDTPELQTSNCENYCHPQPDSALPQNYQDIISICRAMSIRYLWVDSLCIIQDDNGYEFQKEAPLMMNIYQYAVVTLSICWDFPGLSIFRRCSPRSIPRPRPPACYGKHNCGLVSDEWVFVQERETEDNELRLHVSQAPINQRAWVLQERCLSRRLLYLGNDQLYWECDGCTGSEASPESIYAYGGRQSIRALTWRNKDTAWGHMLTQYTGSDLTFENDRLVAMAGLARLIASKTGGTYFAGIWLDSWMGDLLWEPVEERARSSKLKAQEIAMVSPSWSWLIFSGTVRPCLTDLHNGPKISIANPNSFDSGDYQLLALLSQAVVIPPTSDPFAFFERAILKIRCLLLPVTFAGILPSDKQSCFFRHDYDVELSSVGLDCFRLQVCEPYGNIYFTFRFVFSKPLDMSLQYFLLPLYFRQLPPRIYGLVLQKGLRNGSEEYTRAGMWCEDLPVPSQLSPMISNTIIRLGVGKNSTLSYGRLTENEHVFDSKLRKYAAGHVASKVRFPMTVVKKVREHQSDSGELDEKASVSGSEAAGRGLKEADEEEGPFIRIKEVECSLLPHFTTAKWGTVSLV